VKNRSADGDTAAGVGTRPEISKRGAKRHRGRGKAKVRVKKEGAEKRVFCGKDPLRGKKDNFFGKLNKAVILGKGKALHLECSGGRWVTQG